jgi:CheY-like chemotaxis protein
VKHIILLADDSPTIQRLVTQTFVGADFEVVSVSNGDAAVRKFEEVHPDVVLADIYMPGKNGYEVCDYVRRHPDLEKTPVVLLAGAFDAFDEAKARQIGASSHITKPFEPHALVDLVVSLISGKGQAEQAASLASVSPSTEIPMPNAPEPVAALSAPEELVPAAESIPDPPESIPDPAPAPMPEPAPAPALELAPALRLESAPAPAPAISIAAAAVPTPAPRVTPSSADSGDVLGLQELFKPASSAGPVSDEEIERIAERVIQKLSTQVIESVAWDVVPEITTKILKDELKRQS